jgi:hypothetical protein
MFRHDELEVENQKEQNSHKYSCDQVVNTDKSKIVDVLVH